MPVRSILPVAIGAVVLAACSTVSEYTIENRLYDLGLSRAQSDCVAEELNEDLNDRELADFARFTEELTRQDNTRDLFRAFAEISDPDIARATARAGLSCIFAR